MTPSIPTLAFLIPLFPSTSSTIRLCTITAMSAFAPALRALLRPAVSRRLLAPVRTFATTSRVFAAPNRYALREQPRLRLGSSAPDFTAETTHGKLKFHE